MTYRVTKPQGAGIEVNDNRVVVEAGKVIKNVASERRYYVEEGQDIILHSLWGDLVVVHQYHDGKRNPRIEIEGVGGWKKTREIASELRGNLRRRYGLGLRRVV